MEKKRNYKFNIIDLVLIIAILVSLGAIIYASFGAIVTDSERITVRYTVEVPEIRTDFVSKAQEGDTVRDYKTGDSLGKIVSVSANPAKHTGTDSAGALVITEIADYKTMYVTVEASVTKSESGYYVGNYGFTVGSEMSLRLPQLQLEGSCVSIDVVQ